MGTPEDYSISLDELVATARVPFDEQVEQQDVAEHPDLAEAGGHLPGNVRPYAL